MTAKPVSHVAMVRWPEEAGTLERLRAEGTPRLLMVAPDATAPVGEYCDEDWIRMPAAAADVRARASALAARAARHGLHPEVKGDGRIAVQGRWVALSQTEEPIVRALAERFGEVVGPEALAAAPGHQALSPTALRGQIMRLRKRIRPLGLVVRTVRGRGYVLESE